MSETISSVSEQKIAYKKTAPKYVSIEAYYKAEEKSLTKHEYHDGIVIPMAGAKLSHNILAQKSGILMGIFIIENDLNYIVSNSDTKIHIEEYNKIVYPDAVVICENPQFYNNREDTITNPLLVVEVLSPSTARFDKATKFEYYRTLPSFKEYVLIHQDLHRVSVWTKQADGAWLPKDYVGDEATAVLHTINECPISLARLYKGI
jgi:Uma2 family endonuclease